MLPVLVGCERSGVLTKEFRRHGYDAYSCDLEPVRANPPYHFQMDIMKVIPKQRWGLIVLHPDCTAMALSGNRWYGEGRPYHDKRIKQVKWTLRLWNLAKKYSDHVALENPASVIFKELDNVQYVQPWQFGHGETKKTGFALHNLDPLKPTKIVRERNERIWLMGQKRYRKRHRSITYTGIAEAIVDQWGRHTCPRKL